MKRDPLPTGQIDLLLLSILGRGSAHGYAVTETLKVLSGGSFDLPEGTVYPALYRLERDGLLTSAEEVVAGRRRRVYSITRSGKARLGTKSEAWRALVRDVESVLNSDPAHG